MPSSTFHDAERRAIIEALRACLREEWRGVAARLSVLA